MEVADRMHRNPPIRSIIAFLLSAIITGNVLQALVKTRSALTTLKQVADAIGGAVAAGQRAGNAVKILLCVATLGILLVVYLIYKQKLSRNSVAINYYVRLAMANLDETECPAFGGRQNSSANSLRSGDLPSERAFNPAGVPTYRQGPTPGSGASTPTTGPGSPQGQAPSGSASMPINSSIRNMQNAEIEATEKKKELALAKSSAIKNAISELYDNFISQLKRFEKDVPGGKGRIYRAECYALISCVKRIIERILGGRARNWIYENVNCELMIAALRGFIESDGVDARKSELERVIASVEDYGLEYKRDTIRHWSYIVDVYFEEEARRLCRELVVIDGHDDVNDTWEHVKQLATAKDLIGPGGLCIRSSRFMASELVQAFVDDVENWLGNEQPIAPNVNAWDSVAKASADLYLEVRPTPPSHPPTPKWVEMTLLDDGLDRYRILGLEAILDKERSERIDRGEEAKQIASAEGWLSHFIRYVLMPLVPATIPAFSELKHAVDVVLDRSADGAAKEKALKTMKDLPKPEQMRLARTNSSLNSARR